ncbi:MAG: hypothetical protein JWO38_3773 [Gemmataceae bacterium]|nr:hypothetical protein [Gemmataceae bacterium]
MILARLRWAAVTLGLLAAVLLADTGSAGQSADPPKPADPDQLVVDLVSGPTALVDKAFARGEYKHVRAAFAKYFEAKHGPVLKAGLGDDADAVLTWLDANPELKETLYTAIDPDGDNPGGVMGVVRDLWKEAPEAVKAHPNLAVATAVVWDNPKGPYDYRGHQIRTKSLLPDGIGRVGAVENFKYVVDRQTKLKGPHLQLPWEFLVHVVNHRTPADERDWAAAKYLARRPGIGTIYKDVEYDTKMLETRSEVCKLNGKPYTLASIREHGGVCAMQADFAARVAKSVLVPAEYVGGEANSGGRHAWVMWAEVKAVNKDAITFTLESFGRYNVDQYYIGTLQNPQTGKEMTDRDLERRLTAVGSAPFNSRQADLLMRVYPVVLEKKPLTTVQRLGYLKRVLALYPMCDAAWTELAVLHKDGKLTDPTDAAELTNKAVTTFAKFPDFSWTLVDALLTPQKDKGSRTRLFDRLVLSYEQLGRPDLACEARMKLVEYQVDAKDHQKAFTGLANTIRKFPTEGRYVPRMMTRLQEVTKGFKGGPDQLAKFYLEVLPQIPAKRGDEVSKYCVAMHEQAVAFLKENGKPKEAGLVEQNLTRVKASGKPAP